MYVCELEFVKATTVMLWLYVGKSKLLVEA